MSLFTGIKSVSQNVSSIFSKGVNKINLHWSLWGNQTFAAANIIGYRKNNNMRVEVKSWPWEQSVRHDNLNSKVHFQPPLVVFISEWNGIRCHCVTYLEGRQLVVLGTEISGNELDGSIVQKSFCFRVPTHGDQRSWNFLPFVNQSWITF